MAKKLLRKCPACGDELKISRVSCRSCGIEICGDFETDGFLALDNDDLSFIQEFLACEGNISKMQAETKDTYNTIKNKLNAINKKLGSEKKEEFDMRNLFEKKESKVVRTLKEKIYASGGKALMPVLKGEQVPFWLSSTQLGFESAGLKRFIFEWEVFDAIVKRANELGGKMYRGDSAAQGGARIGSEQLPVTTIDGFISTEFYGAEIGDTALRRSTYFSGILAWAGIVTNHRSQGQGGFITVNPEFRK